MSNAHPTAASGTSPDAPIRHVLSAESISEILTAIRTADSTAQLVENTVRTLYRAILAERPAPATSPIQPDDYALPSTQWQAILSAVVQRAEQWGAQGLVGVEFAVTLMPHAYDDPAVPAPDVPLPDYRPAVRTLEWARDAADVVTAVADHLDQLRTAYGPASPWFLDAADSWQRALTAVITMNGGATTTVSKYGPMDLFVRTGGGLVYAVVFHPVARGCTVAGCGARLLDDGTFQPPATGSAVPEHQHVASYPLDGPRPGTWSLHS